MPEPTHEGAAGFFSDAAALIEKIASVQACRITAENGAPREIHILADDSRSPKQIARDVQSALSAQFDLDVDYRLISIAQIPRDLAAAPCAPAASRRLVCNRLALSRNQWEIEVTVSLALGDQICQTTERGLLGDRQRILARAAAGAISQFLPEDSRLRINDTGETTIDGKRVLLAGVALETATGIEFLVGAAYDREDSDLTMVHAVLDAVNRRLRL